MKHLDMEKLQEIIDIYEQFQEKGKEIAKILMELEEYSSGWKIEDIKIEYGSVYAYLEKWEYYCGESEHETDTLEIPLSYFFNDDWQENAKAEIRLRREKEAEEKRKRDEKKVQDHIKSEWTRLQNLQKKFISGEYKDYVPELD